MRFTPCLVDSNSTNSAACGEIPVAAANSRVGRLNGRGGRRAGRGTPAAAHEPGTLLGVELGGFVADGWLGLVYASIVPAWPLRQAGRPDLALSFREDWREPQRLRATGSVARTADNMNKWSAGNEGGGCWRRPPSGSAIPRERSPQGRRVSTTPGKSDGAQRHARSAAESHTVVRRLVPASRARPRRPRGPGQPKVDPMPSHRCPNIPAVLLTPKRPQRGLVGYALPGTTASPLEPEPGRPARVRHWCCAESHSRALPSRSLDGLGHDRVWLRGHGRSYVSVAVLPRRGNRFVSQAARRTPRRHCPDL